MIIKKIYINNFRCLKNIRVDLNKNTVFLGENNSGKTAILDAIRIALSKNLTPNVFSELDFYMGKGVSSPRNADNISIVLDFETDGSFIKDNETEYLEFIKYVGSQINISVGIEASYNNQTSAIDVNKYFIVNGRKRKIGSTNSSTKLLKKLLDFNPIFHLQALRGLNDTFSLNSPIWAEILKKIDVPREDIQAITSNFKDINARIFSDNTVAKSLIDELELMQKVIQMTHDESVSIDAIPLKDWDLLSKSQVVLRNKNMTEPLPISVHGQGVHSLAAILIFKAYISIFTKELTQDNFNLILSLEEPEAHLHPQAIRALWNMLDKIDCQKFITTHSPYFIQNTDLRDIRLIKKVNGETVVTQITPHVVLDVSDSESLNKLVAHKSKSLELIGNQQLIVKEQLDDNLIRSVEKHLKQNSNDNSNKIADLKNIFSKDELYYLNMFIQKTRGDILFARSWFLYEGQSEEIILNYFAEVLGVDFDSRGISGIVYRSNGNAKSFTKLARVLNVPWVLLADNDKQGRNTYAEIVNSGYTNKEVNERFCLTQNVDIEHDLIKNESILEDYEKILVLTDEEKRLKLTNKEEYLQKLLEKIQSNKVNSAYKLVEIWDERGFSQEDIPSYYVDLINKIYNYDKLL